MTHGISRVTHTVKSTVLIITSTEMSQQASGKSCYSEFCGNASRVYDSCYRHSWEIFWPSWFNSDQVLQGSSQNLDLHLIKVMLRKMCVGVWVSVCKWFLLCYLPRVSALFLRGKPPTVSLLENIWQQDFLSICFLLSCSDSVSLRGANGQDLHESGS